MYRLLPDDHDAFIELSGPLPQRVRAMKSVQGTLVIVKREKEVDDSDGL